MIEIRQTVNSNLMAYRGSSEEDKPMTCAPGSTFYEWDTASGYMFDGEDWLLQTSGGGGGGGKEVYAIGGQAYIDGNMYTVMPNTNTSQMHVAKNFSPGTGPSGYVFTAGKGDEMYFVYVGDTSGVANFAIAFINLDAGGATQGLLRIDPSEMEQGESFVYTQITIPSTDVDGNDWGADGGYIGISIIPA